MKLVAFTSCDEALAGLRSAARSHVGPWGFQGDPRLFDVRPDSAGAPDAAAGRSAIEKAPTHSGTNTHEVGADEPDIVKTDGRRIVTVSRGRLRVVDPAAGRLTGELDLMPGADEVRWTEANLLLHGDRALVLIATTSRDFAFRPAPADRVRPAPGSAGKPASPSGTDKPVSPDGSRPDTGIVGPTLIMVDLSGPPRTVGQYQIDGSLVDARQVGATARVVVRSTPRLAFPAHPRATDQQRTAANRAIIDRATETAWLPRYRVASADGDTRTGQIGCDRLSRPTTYYSGTSLLTVLSFGLDAADLGDGDPVTVAADGETVYSNGSRLYLSNDRRWRILPARVGRPTEADPHDERTEIYQFDLAKPGRPRYVASASVPGWLINQYAMSEWDGHLRVATTSGRTWGEKPTSSSAVYVLRADGTGLVETGRVTGLGRGERIHGVRFVGGTGYVVTFRQTDPLYTVDLRNPAAPRVTGELKITGYSSYLHPISPDRLLGVGQEADRSGRTRGTQLSLFDVSDPARPNRLAQHHVRRGHSEAEFDPHAFLYWPATNLVVVPITTYDANRAGRRLPSAGALALQLTDRGFTELGLVEHPVAESSRGVPTIRRSLVVDGVLWTLSDAGLRATELTTMAALRWLPLS